MSSSNQELQKFDEIIKRCDLTEEGNPARYRLKTSTDNLDQSKPYRTMTFGERDKNKPHKTILLVGETGTGKTTLINTMINYMLGVKREDKVWFEITDDQSDRTSVYSQTSSVTVYGFYPQDSPIHLTVIDTPGYGNTRGIDLDKEISKSLLSLSKSAEEIHEIHAVCLVIVASLTQLSDRQIYIFDAVQSLFGRDIAENIVLLLTHSSGTQPKNALKAVEEAKIKCAVNKKNQPVFFLFNNRQSDPADEDDETMHAQLWDQSFKKIEEFFKFLDTIKPKTLRKYQEVFYQHELKAYISSLQQCDLSIKQKQEELKKAQGFLKQDEENVKNNKNSKCEGEVSNREKVDTDPAVAKDKISTICENCPPPDSSLQTQISLKDHEMPTNKCLNKETGISLKDDYYKMPANKCLNKENKTAQIDGTISKKGKTHEDPKKEYDDKIGNSTLSKKLEEELQELEREKIKHAFDAFRCVDVLLMITHNIDSLPRIDFLIEKLKELNEPKKVSILENIKQEAEKEKEKTKEH